MKPFILHVAQYNMPKMNWDRDGRSTFTSRDYTFDDVERFHTEDVLPFVKMYAFVKRFEMEYKLYHETEVWGEEGRMRERHKLMLRIMNETQALLFKMEFSEFLLEIS